MVAEGFCIMDLKRSLGLEGALSASKADSPLNGDASGSMCPRGTGNCCPPPRFSPAPVLRATPWHPGRAPRVALELGNQLRPDGDHPNEKCDRRQRRRLFHEYV